MASYTSLFPSDALSADRSNHGLWTPPTDCDACTSQTCTSPRKYSFSQRRATATQRSSEYTVDSQSAPPSPSSASTCSTTASEEERRSRVQGKRIAQIIKLRPEHVEEYKKIHKAVWPGVLKQIKDSGIRDCTFSLHTSAQFLTKDHCTTINGSGTAIGFLTSVCGLSRMGYPLW